MVELVHQAEDASKFSKHWPFWLYFIMTDEYKQALT